MPEHRFRLDDLPAMSWKNGGGTTREILCWPPGADVNGFDLRVSVASITQAGPFSAFAGVDRTIMLLDGDGVQLLGDGVHHRLHVRHAPFAFSGDLSLGCELLGGPSTDFNVMARRGRGQATVEVVEGPHALPAGGVGLVLALRGRYQLRAGAVLTPREGVWWAEPAPGVALSPASSDARAVVVRWAACAAQPDGGCAGG